MAAVSVENDSSVGAIDNLRDEILEKIKNLAWKLNYSYEYGQESLEIKEMIA